MLKIGGNEAYEINDEDVSLVSRGCQGISVRSGYPGYPMVALASLMLRNSCVLILPSSSGLSTLMSVLPTDKRFGKLVDRHGIARLSPVLSCGIMEVDRDLGMVAGTIMGELIVGERNGIEP
jgi:hypothetical protein